MESGESPRLRTAELLDLRPHPEGGWFRETWRSGLESVPVGYPGPRAAATAIYFLLGPGEESRWHRVRSAEIWLWHSGGPLLLLDGGAGERPASAGDAVTLGPDLAAGQLPQHVVPPGHWQAARPAGDGEVLVSCVVAPGFDFADFTLFTELISLQHSITRPTPRYHSPLELSGGCLSWTNLEEE